MRVVRAIGVLVVAALLFFVGQQVARAHANFLRSDPPADSDLQTAPERLQLWFTEPLEHGFSQVQVIDANRQRVDRNDSLVLREDTTAMVVSLQPLDKGTYTVSWKALSAVDGHVTRGFFTLSIGVGGPVSPPPPSQEVPAQLPFEAAVRWLGYLSVAAVVGGLLFRLLVLERIAGLQGASHAVLPASLPVLRRLISVGWVMLLVATLASLVFQVIAVSGDDSDTLLGGTIRQLLLGTRYGLISLVRLALILVLGLALVLLAQKRWAWWLAMGLGAAIVFTTSLNSHSAATVGLAALAIAADWLHLLGVAVWVGGLFSLVVVLPGTLGALAPSDRWSFLAKLVPRFSALAAASVFAIIGSSLYLAWLHVGSVGALLETLYGNSLMVKVALITPLLLSGAANLLIIRPRLTEAVAGAGEMLRAAWLGRYFSRLVLAEAVLAGLVLLATGALTSLSPGRQTYEQLQTTRPLAMQDQARDLRLTLSIAPARPGANTFTVLVTGPDGRPVANAERVSVILSYLEEALGSSVEVGEPQGDGRYVARASAISVEGRWQAEVLVRRAGFEDARTAFRFRVTPTSAEQERSTSVTPTLGLPSINLMTSVGLGIMLFGIGLVAYVARSVSLRSLEGGALIVASLVVVGLGVNLAIQAQASIGAAASATQLTNPFPPTQESLATDERVYRADCQACHGVNGRGDGPAGLALQPPPADFRIHMAAGHTDAQLFTWLSEGMVGTAMPAYKDRLSVEQRWHVLNFLRTFAQN